MATLTLGAWLDYRQRMVPNLVWIVALAISFPFLVTESIHAPVDFAWRLLGFMAASVAAFLLWGGQQVGGADAKAVMLAGLLLGPVGYWNPSHAHFLPVLDALPVALLAGEAYRRIRAYKTIPWLTALLPCLALSLALGGLFWWPIAILVRLVS